jgi:hypothetical protein
MTATVPPRFREPLRHAATAAVAIVACLALVLPGYAQHRDDNAGVVEVANLIYGNNQTSKCFANDFLRQIEQDTHVRTVKEFAAVRMDSLELFHHPFAIWTGDGTFVLTESQRQNLRDYLLSGGFIVASASCSSSQWNNAFVREMQAVFPDYELKTLDADHPVFHTVHDVTTARYRSGPPRLPRLDGLEIDGRIVMIYSPDGLNDTDNAGPGCCCCGGNEIRSAKLINANLLAYALTH